MTGWTQRYLKALNNRAFLIVAYGIGTGLTYVLFESEIIYGILTTWKCSHCHQRMHPFGGNCIVTSGGAFLGKYHDACYEEETRVE